MMTNTCVSTFIPHFRRIFSLFLALAFLVGCGAPAANPAAEEKPLRIVATIFPLYDWVREILGGQARNTELTLLLDNGSDLHSYQPTVDDIIKISTCDLFLYVGGESDEWIEDALAGAINPDMVVINLLEAMGDAVKEEEIIEGMENDPDADGEDGIEYDEHVWLSLKNAALLCGEIAGALGRLDPVNSGIYASNAAAYTEKLDALDSRYTAAVSEGRYHTVLFGDRFPFRYLTDDYGLDYYAAFVGCSAETEASFKTVIFLAEKVDELELPAILTLETGDGKLARTIAENTSLKTAVLLQMNSLQAVTAEDIAAGMTYLSAMEHNLDTLKQALN